MKLRHLAGLDTRSIPGRVAVRLSQSLAGNAPAPLAVVHTH